MLFDKQDDLTKEFIRNHDPIEEKLHVIAVVSNPCNYKIRYKLASDYLSRMEKDENCISYLVELVYGDQEFVLTDPNNKRHLQLRGDIPLWHKENMINLGIKYLLPEDWKAVAWVDADIEFDNPNWALDALKILNNGYDCIQLFTNCFDLDYFNQIMNLFTGFGYQYKSNFKKGIDKSYWHPGFAWAINRTSYEKVGGIFEVGILGSGDNIMCHTAIKRAHSTLKTGMAEGYISTIADYQDKFVDVKFGYVPGSIKHYFHGKKVNRKYLEREDILIKHQYCPKTQMTYDEVGLIIPSKDCPQGLIDDVMQYFVNRNEDEMVEEEIKGAIPIVKSVAPVVKSVSVDKKAPEVKKSEIKSDEINNVLFMKSTDLKKLESKVDFLLAYINNNNLKLKN